MSCQHSIEKRGTRTKSLSTEIREMQIIARDLGYPEDRIKKFNNATSSIELQNMMISARRSLS